MNKKYYIYWRPDFSENSKEGEMFANVHLLIGYTDNSLESYKKMAEELRETFPQATDDQIGIGKIYKSDFDLGYSIVTFNAFIPKKEYPGWLECDPEKIEYQW